MSRSKFSRLSQFTRNDSGSIAMIFALVITGIIGITALAVDMGRAYSVKSKMAAIMDSAALAGARAMVLQGKSDAQVEQIMLDYFNSNVASHGLENVVSGSPNVTVTRRQEEVAISAQTRTQTQFASSVGTDAVTQTHTATASMPTHDVEVAFALDFTGSMDWVAAGGSQTKFEVLRTATQTSIGTLFDVATRDDSVRVAIAPWAETVRPESSSIANLTGNASDICVSERGGWTVTSDVAPAPGDFIGHDKMVSDSGSADCPSTTVLSMRDKTQRAEVGNYITDMGPPDGGTSGHMGAAWAWYLLSPNFSSVFASPAKDYGSAKKVAVIMSDGLFNLFNQENDTTNAENESYRVFQELCTNMKTQREIKVFTVGFDLDGAPQRAKDELRDCATSSDYFFDAKDQEALNRAFGRIVDEVKHLRLKS